MILKLHIAVVPQCIEIGGDSFTDGSCIGFGVSSLQEDNAYCKLYLLNQNDSLRSNIINTNTSYANYLFALVDYGEYIIEDQLYAF